MRSEANPPERPSFRGCDDGKANRVHFCKRIVVRAPGTIGEIEPRYPRYGDCVAVAMKGLVRVPRSASVAESLPSKEPYKEREPDDGHEEARQTRRRTG